MGVGGIKKKTEKSNFRICGPLCRRVSEQEGKKQQSSRAQGKQKNVEGTGCFSLPYFPG